MPINPKNAKYHYIAKADLYADLRLQFAGAADVRVHETVGVDGYAASLTEADTTEGYDSIDFEGDGVTVKQIRRIPALLTSIQDAPAVQAVVIPVHRPSWIIDSAGKRAQYEKGNHWDGYVLLRDASGTMQALRLTTPGDGYCGGHFIHLASELVNHGLDAFRRGRYAGYLQSLSAEGFSEDIATDAAQLVSIGVRLFDAEALAPITAPAAGKRVRFGAEDVKEFYKDAPASSVGKPEQPAKAAREEAGFAPVRDPAFEQQVQQASDDYHQMEAIKRKVALVLQQRFPKDAPESARFLLQVYTRALAIEEGSEQFQGDYLSTIDFGGENYERQIECLAVSASLNPEFNAWFDETIAVSRTASSHNSRLRLHAPAGGVCASEARDPAELQHGAAALIV